MYPAAFNEVVGPAHFELLARARAMDTQTFVVACSPALDPSPSAVFRSHGHSVVATPFGMPSASRPSLLNPKTMKRIQSRNDGENNEICFCDVSLPRSDLSFSHATKRWSRPLFQLDLIRNVSFAFCHSVAHSIAAVRTVQECKGAIKGKAH